MYIRNIKILGYGSIDGFDYAFSKDEANNPKPLVLLGKNGSGKSLVLANIVDALVEIKRSIYPGGILEVSGNNYYKVGRQTYIKNDKRDSIVKIDFENDGKKYSYHDVMSRDPEKAVSDSLILNEIGTFFNQNKISRLQ